MFLLFKGKLIKHANHRTRLGAVGGNQARLDARTRGDGEAGRAHHCSGFDGNKIALDS